MNIRKFERFLSELEDRLGARRPILFYGPTQKEAEDNRAEYLLLHPEAADRPMQLVVTWGGAPPPCEEPQLPIFTRETEHGTWVARPKQRP